MTNDPLMSTQNLHLQELFLATFSSQACEPCLSALIGKAIDSCLIEVVVHHSEVDSHCLYANLDEFAFSGLSNEGDESDDQILSQHFRHLNREPLYSRYHTCLA